MKKLTWSQIEEMSDTEITYLLYLEGKDIKTICRIRGIDRVDAERHIIEGKIKYRIFEGTKNTEDIVKRLLRCHKDERQNALKIMGTQDIKKLERYALENLYTSTRDECLFYIWLLGEIKSKDAVQAIITFLRCRDGNIKRICCSALGKIGDLRAEDSLILCLDENRTQIKEYAIKALGRIKSKKALERLKKISLDENERDYIKRLQILPLMR
ncbi:hypothetical protein Q428_00825 [Fervidicella metallireducens AeB]|uniref:PBS lyase n=1 Tax=Fervidicella metallireducens AeB TaxID=1403537 RepID=A0A017RY56_9CLOT|nr:HEAT repeat domain-containing protein [Fervidicella metallireducens]EYE89708.1 hypothetical protein Q428_00825 [Fervidicella metallireducens AeB]